MISIAAALAVDSAANFFYQLALVLMKIAHHNTENFRHKSSFTQPIWLCGLFLLISCTVVRVSKSSSTDDRNRSASVRGPGIIYRHLVTVSYLRRVSCHYYFGGATSPKVWLYSNVSNIAWLCLNRDAVQLYINDLFGIYGDRTHKRATVYCFLSSLFCGVRPYLLHRIAVSHLIFNW